MRTVNDDGWSGCQYNSEGAMNIFQKKYSFNSFHPATSSVAVSNSSFTSDDRPSTSTSDSCVFKRFSVISNSADLFISPEVSWCTSCLIDVAVLSCVVPGPTGCCCCCCCWITCCCGCCCCCMDGCVDCMEICLTGMPASSNAFFFNVCRIWELKSDTLTNRSGAKAEQMKKLTLCVP